MGKAFLVIDTPHEMVITDPKGEIHAIQAYLEQKGYSVDVIENPDLLSAKMEKAFLVIDTPHKSCYECRLCYQKEDGPYIRSICAVLDQWVPNPKEKPDWCPLIPFPEKQIIHCIDTPHHRWMKDGWNYCVNEIMKKFKENEK